MSRLFDFIDTELLKEAFSNSNISKAIKNIKVVVEKGIGSKLLPFGKNDFELFKRSNGISGMGIYYLVDKTGYIVRFNWEKHKKSNTITSVDVWTHIQDVIDKPDATLDIPKDFNIIQSVNIIVNFIKKPRAGVINEARGDKKRQLALQWDLDPNMTYNDIRKAVSKKKKLMALKGISENNTIVNEVDKAQKELDKQKYADPDIVFDDLDDLVRMVASNIQPSLLITGMAGIGKTYEVTNVLSSVLGPEGNKWVHIKGKLSPVGMYRTFFLNRHKLIVFDDADSVFGNQDTNNMLKAALDSYDKRTLSWISPLTVDVSRLDNEQIQQMYDDIEDALSTDPGSAKIKFPNKFDFEGQVIFISNLPASKIDSAVKSRSLTIDVTLSRESVIKRIQSIIDHVGGDLVLNEKQEVLDYLAEHYKNELNIRSFVLGCRCKQSGSANWQRLINYA